MTNSGDFPCRTSLIPMQRTTFTGVGLVSYIFWNAFIPSSTERAEVSTVTVPPTMTSQSMMASTRSSCKSIWEWRTWWWRSSSSMCPSRGSSCRFCRSRTAFSPTVPRSSHAPCWRGDGRSVRWGRPGRYNRWNKWSMAIGGSFVVELERKEELLGAGRRAKELIHKWLLFWCAKT